jgi:NodT family efflux transporter outer membrane factor (OMF) lipoprotein
LALALLGAGCAVGPKYQRPAAPVAPSWEVTAPWREGAPRDAAPKGEWWLVFHDDGLDRFEAEALAANQTLEVAVARMAQARAGASTEVAGLFPTLGTTPSVERQRLSANRPPNGPTPVAGSYTQSVYNLPFTVSYEADLFGQKRRSLEAANATYQASAADLENVRLSVTAEVARNYFTLRQLDAEIETYKRGVEAFEKGLELVNGRHRGGIASGLDVAQEETLLYATRTQAQLLLQQRKETEDALAVLLGKAAPGFSVPASGLIAEPPALQLGLPSDLLERRPDVAEAERQVAAANARIGVAKGAYYPSLSLFGTGGWQAASLGKLVNAASTLWAVGASVAETLFSGGARRAGVELAVAGHRASVATYRQTVLSALAEVQDAVTGLQVLDGARATQAQAVRASRRALDIANSRYVGGLVSYLDVVNAQESLLNNEREMATIEGQRLVTSVLLVKALGGGWDAASLATVKVKARPADLVSP